MYKLFQRILALALTLGLLLSLAATAFAVEADEETISISTAEELAENPRARSAKLRVAERCGFDIG